MKRFLQTIAGVGAVGLAGYEVTRRYGQWLDAVTERASRESHIAYTKQGEVQYDLRGMGEIVLHFHGGNVGHNGWFMLQNLIDAGFTVLTPDRPGYLGTPIAGNGSPERQADVFAALLDTLDIDSVAVVGVSAGGAGALQFALRYPERTKCLVLLSAITRKTMLTENQLNSTLGRLVMSPRGQNPAYFLIQQAMKRMPATALQDYARTETTYDEDEAQ
ncbi:MAG: alpha/beta fold hydrolase, partial [Anaerolineae bacterium]|nr:alpha/beta fold hydrolase [Anaerolineae bacterium]